jgi:hypothetical protein
MANKFNGVGVLFGLSGVSGFASGTFYTQSLDQSSTSDMEELRNSDGGVAGVSLYNFTSEATIEYIPVSTVAINGTLTPNIYATGDKLTIGDSNDTALAGSNWLVTNVDKKRSNTTALRVTLKLKRWDSMPTL